MTIPLRQPLQSLSLGQDYHWLKDEPELIEVIKDEVNVKEIIFI